MLIFLPGCTCPGSRNDPPEARATQQLHVASRAISQRCCPRWGHVSNREKIRQTSGFTQAKGQTRLLLRIYPRFHVALCVKVAVFGRVGSKVATAAATIRFSSVGSSSRLICAERGSNRLRPRPQDLTAAPDAAAGGNNCSKVELKEPMGEKRAALQDRCRVSGDAAPRP